MYVGRSVEAGNKSVSHSNILATSSMPLTNIRQHNCGAILEKKHIRRRLKPSQGGERALLMVIQDLKAFLEAGSKAVPG